MHAIQQTEPTAVGDLIVAGGHTVGSERIMGEILEIRGEPGHERYRVRWEDGHESIFHPTDGEASIHHHRPREASAGLLRLLADQKIDVELRRHQRTESAIDEARALHASADRVGKTLVVHTPKGMVRVVIAASARLSLAKLRSRDRLRRDQARDRVRAGHGLSGVRARRGATVRRSERRSDGHRPPDRRARLGDRRSRLAFRIGQAGASGHRPPDSGDDRGCDSRLSHVAIAVS